MPCCAAAATATIWTEGGGLAAQGRVMSQSIVTVDIGGTHARFAIAEVEGGRCIALGGPTTLHTEDHASFQSAWQDFERRQGRSLPRSVALAIAGPTKGEIIRFTNNPWIIRPEIGRASCRERVCQYV